VDRALEPDGGRMQRADRGKPPSGQARLSTAISPAASSMNRHVHRGHGAGIAPQAEQRRAAGSELARAWRQASAVDDERAARGRCRIDAFAAAG
jgi:hypothetical protein